MGLLCIFCSRWRLGQNFGAAQVQPLLAWVCGPWKSGRRNYTQRSRENLVLESLLLPFSLFRCVVDGFLQTSELLVLGMSIEDDQTNLGGL